MRVSLEWLREYVDVDEAPAVLAERLSGVGLGVEAIERAGDDTVLDLEITANRPDCMSVLGVAREVALLLGRPLRRPDGDADPPAGRAGPTPRLRRGAARSSGSGGVSVTIEDPEGCPRFTAAVIQGVRVGPSPEWMRRRLEATGVRAINNVVDVTNYVMLELGQPMHAFDYEKVAGRRLVVRRARRGETVLTLDGVSRALDDGVLVVADAEHAVSLAGIIGGRETEIGPGATTVLLEAAYWDPPTIGRTARRLGVRTEAAARFERGADPNGPPRAQARAARLMAEVCGGRAAPPLLDVYPRPAAPRVITLRPRRAAAVLGVEIPHEEMARILRALGCGVGGTRVLRVRPPTFRPDLAREEDLIEEVIRIHGYDRVPLTLPRGDATPGAMAPALAADGRVREILTRCGLSEVLTLTLVRAEPRGGHGDGLVLLRNPLTIDQGALRRSLLPGLIEVLATNAALKVADVQIFELGPIFLPRGAEDRPSERRALGLAVTGRWRTGWNIPDEQAVADFYHLRWILDAVLGGLGLSGWQVAPQAPVRARDQHPFAPGDWWHPERAAAMTVLGGEVARFGELHPDRAARHRLSYRAYMAEVDLEEVARLAGGGAAAASLGVYTGLPRYPEVERDLAAVVPEDLPADRIEAIIRDAAGPLLEGVELFDVYTGAPVPPGRRNLAYRLRLRAPDRTLVAGEAEEIVGRVRIALRTRAGAQLRE